MVDEVLTKTLLSSLSDSDAEKKSKQKSVGRPKRRRKPVKSLPVQTDSEDEEVVKPTVPSPRASKPLCKTPSGSECEVKSNSKREKPFSKRQSSTSRKMSTDKISKKTPGVPSNATSKVLESEPVSKRGRKRIIKPPTTNVPEEDTKRKRVVSNSESDDDSWTVYSKVTRKRNSRHSAKESSSDRNKRESWNKLSSSDEEIIISPLKPVSRVMPASSKRVIKASSESDMDKDENTPKLDSEGVIIHDKKKNDTLRKLFPKRDNESSGVKSGGKSGGKGVAKVGGKCCGGKGGGKTGIKGGKSGKSNIECEPEKIAKLPKIDVTLPIPPQTSQNTRIQEAFTVENTKQKSHVFLPPLKFINGKPSLMCSLDLSRLPHIPSKRRSEEIRIRTELSDTRQSKTKKDSDSKSEKRERKSSGKHRSRDEKVKKRKRSPVIEAKEETQKSNNLEIIKRLTPEVTLDSETASTRYNIDLIIMSILYELIIRLQIHFSKMLFKFL